MAAPASALAQAVSRPFPVWDGGTLPEAAVAARIRITAPDSGAGRSDRNHTLTGMLIGSAVGVVAATVFLTQFCDDPDTKCDTDEVGRAVVLFTVPPALVGALIGSLIPKGD